MHGTSAVTSLSFGDSACLYMRHGGHAVREQEQAELNACDHGLGEVRHLVGAEAGQGLCDWTAARVDPGTGRYV